MLGFPWFEKMTDSLKKTATPDLLAARFSRLGIESVTFAHKAVFTVEEGRDIEVHIPGAHTKNLFLKDKKGQLWLVTALAETQIDLKTLPRLIGAARLSFGSASLLEDILGVKPGSVTPFALMNDSSKRVIPVLDRKMMDFDIVNFHPLTNTMTTAVRPADLLLFMKDLGYDPLVIHLEERSALSTTDQEKKYGSRY